MDIRLIGIDMDGTLLNSRQAVPPQNHRALMECEKRGIAPVLCSGRIFQSLRAHADKLGMTSPLISCNGARIDKSPDGDALREWFLDAGELALAVRIFGEEDVYYTIYTPDALYLSCPAELADLTLHEPVIRAGAHSLAHVGYDVWKGRFSMRAYKIAGFSNEQGKIQRLWKRLEREGLSNLSSSWFNNIELMPQGVNKGAGLLYLAETMGIGKSQIMAFGDHNNDMSMLKAVGWPVAMENGQDELKAIAKIIAPHHDEAGVGRVIAQKVLGENVHVS